MTSFIKGSKTILNLERASIVYQVKSSGIIEKIYFEFEEPIDKPVLLLASQGCVQ